MNKKTVYLIVGLLAVSAFLFWLSKPEPAEAVDVVNGIRPASTSLQGIHGYAEELARLPEAERAAYLEKERPQLQQGVVYFLRHGVKRLRPEQTVDRVEFFFGSLDKVQAHDADGKVHQGYFKDQLVARVHVADAEPIDVLVKCLNRWFVLPGQIEQLQPIGQPRLVVESFKIGRGEGLVHHVDYPVAIDLAAKHDLPLYRGRVQSTRNQITPDVARDLESQTNRTQVTVGVVEGDKFDLIAMTFEASPLRTRRK